MFIQYLRDFTYHTSNLNKSCEYSEFYLTDIDMEVHSLSSELNFHILKETVRNLPGYYFVEDEDIN